VKRFQVSALILAALAFIAGQAQAQTVVGSSGGATFIIDHGNVRSVATILSEIEYQFPWGEEEFSKNWGALVSYVGISAEGGGETVGLGYRQYRHVGGVYPGFGIGGFALGENTPEITELSLFLGPELLLEVPLGEEDNDKVTGFLGVYQAISGQDATVVRAGIRAALN
jgi:hypothetical protein